MPITYHVDPVRRLIETTVSGDAGHAEIRGHLQRLRADPAYSPDYDALIDLRAVTRIPTAEEIRAEVPLIRQALLTARTRRAIIVSRPVMYGMMRVFEAYQRGSPAEYEVFYEVPAALEWIDEGRAAARARQAVSPLP
jgi:hypothetical protein